MPRFENPSADLDSLMGGYMGVLFRLRACSDYATNFAVTLNRRELSEEDRCEQERLLFGFFVSGVAALDSFGFFLHFVASRIRPAPFPTQPEELWRISMKGTRKKFADEFPGDLVTAKLQDALKRLGPFYEWEAVRNVLAHRAVPPRDVFAVAGGRAAVPVDDWKLSPSVSLKMDADLTRLRLQWLVDTLSELAAATDDFTQKHF